MKTSLVHIIAYELSAIQITLSEFKVIYLLQSFLNWVYRSLLRLKSFNLYNKFKYLRHLFERSDDDHRCLTWSVDYVLHAT